MSTQESLFSEEEKLQYYKIKSSTLKEMKDLLSSMKGNKEQKLQDRIRELEEELKHLRNTKKYGLVWDQEREPEQVVADCQKKLPILKEVKERKILSEDSGDSNILIEGDNYHALQVLSYTHKEAIDVIYIDPPYNTGIQKEGRTDFVYNDSFIDKEDTFRHSKWLNFMEKRLKIARDLLKEDGVIFISIDDNEQAQLKLLCDEIFGEPNLVGKWNWFKSSTPPNLSNKIKKNIEYIYGYERVKNNSKYRGVKKESKSTDPLTKPQNSYKVLTFPANTIFVKSENKVFKSGIYGTKKFPNELLNNMEILNGKNKNTISFKNRFTWTQDKLNSELENNTKIFCSKDGVLSYKKENYSNEVPPNLIDDSVGVSTTEQAGNDLIDIFGEKVFDYPKPIDLINYLINFREDNKYFTILDFFAGSGTTGHAVLDLNKEDGGNRKFILCTNNENNICEEVTYERVKRVSQGYANVKGKEIEGLGGNLRYYKTAFVEVENLQEITDEKKLELTYNAGELLAIKEGVYNEKLKTEYGQVFENTKDIVAIYFQESTKHLQNMAIELSNIQKEKGGKVIWYIYGNPFDRDDFSEIKNLELKDIPDPILKVYREINKV